METKIVSDKLTVTGQVDTSDIEQIVSEGYTDVICARPDFESSDQPTAESLLRQFEIHGIRFHHIPVVVGQIPSSAVAAFGEAVEAAEGQILGYCRSGTRAATLWSLYQEQGGSAEIIDVA